jgi:hypothetical protein
MQQVESVSQNNTVSAVFVHVHICVCACARVFACGNTCTHRLIEGTRFDVLTEVLPRIKLVWNVTLSKTTRWITWSRIFRRSERIV